MNPVVPPIAYERAPTDGPHRIQNLNLSIGIQEFSVGILRDDRRSERGSP
jgi:hypothetical protein